MNDKRDEVWYCENSKGHKIAPYGGNMDNYNVPKPKRWNIERVLNIFGVLVGLFILLAFCFALSSCATLTDTELVRRNKIDYELNKLYYDFEYHRDSLIIEYYRTDVIKEDGVQWYTIDTIKYKKVKK